MAKIIRFIIWIVWIAMVALMAFILYDVITTEPDQQILWSWIVISLLVFTSVSLLAYNVVYHGKRKKSLLNDD